MNTGEREGWFSELGRIERRMNAQVYRAADNLVRTAAGTFRSAMPAGVIDKVSRVEHVRDALEQSAPLARQLATTAFSGSLWTPSGRS